MATLAKGEVMIDDAELRSVGLSAKELLEGEDAQSSALDDELEELAARRRFMSDEELGDEADPGAFGEDSYD
jgi:hypothetical protein